MYTGLLHLHSSLRYLVIIFVLLSIIFALTSKSYEKRHKITSLLGLIFSHIQFILGWAMFFIGGMVSFWKSDEFMKEKYLRFWALEHPLAMTLGIVFVTLGYGISKRKADHKVKLRSIYIYYTIGLILILAVVPWPFREVIGRGWFVGM